LGNEEKAAQAPGGDGGFLETVGVYSGYGETEILHGVSIRVDRGEMVAIIGPNGAGKSTFVKTVIGLLKPTRGKIMFEGRDITGKSPEDLVHHGLAYIPQMNNTFPALTVLENLQVGAISRRPGLLGRLNRETMTLIKRLLPIIFRHGIDDGTRIPAMTRVEFDERVEQVVSIFPNLRPKLNVRVGTMSGGEQQMVALAKTLVLDPRLLLIDEPSAGLAPKLVQLIFQKIQEINDRGVGIVLVEQNARKALALADRGYVLEGGKNRYEGPGQALLNDPDVGRLYLGG
jgi:ABC-type branched-subunit amino acid transport system ATPase component